MNLLFPRSRVPSRCLAAFSCLITALLGWSSLAQADDVSPAAKQRNVVFILADDHRYDAMGFLGHPFLKTPQLDRMAKSGVYMKNAFVTTSLCSPSRASILTGQYMHNHRVTDNNNPAPEGTIFFPQYLQKAGYRTAFIGKWHMGGESDEPRPGFDRWVSFRGQGNYLSPGPNYTLNVDGKRVPQKGYITDELTDYAVDWLEGLGQEEPFFLYLSHKAVHAEFVPAERHKDLYADVEIQLPEAATAEITDPNVPLWVKNQRNSWHGVDFPYHSDLDVAEYYRDYCRALAGVDDSVGRVLDWLEAKGLADETLVIYMGDNGFLFGEHGLIDKRNAYEESMRVPMLVRCPELFGEGKTSEAVVANIDVAGTVLEAAGIESPEHFDGESFLGLLAGTRDPKTWRKGLLYEYYWEWNFPHTPTVVAFRGERYKFIQYLGVWDTDELYDLETDPTESRNLIRDPEQKDRVVQMRNALWKALEETGGMQIPLSPKRGDGANLRNAEGSEAAEFPEYLLRRPKGAPAR